MEQEWPVSETELLDEPCRMSTIRFVLSMSKHRELSAPFFVADASRVNYEDIEVFSNAAIGEIALINASGQDVKSVFQPATSTPNESNACIRYFSTDEQTWNGLVA